MRKHPTQAPSACNISVWRRAVSRPRCEGSRLQNLRLLVKDLHVLIDPLLFGVYTDKPTSLGVEAVER